MPRAKKNNVKENEETKDTLNNAAVSDADADITYRRNKDESYKSE